MFLIIVFLFWICLDEKNWFLVFVGYLGKWNELKFRGNLNKYNLDENDSYMKYINIGYKMIEVDELDVNFFFRVL